MAAISGGYISKERQRWADVKMEYIHAVTNFIMAELQPFTIVVSPEFCSLFCPFQKEADKITDVPPN